MLYFLHLFKDSFILFNLFRYITFRAAAASITAFLLCLVFGPPLMRLLKRIKFTANQQREHAESIHGFYAHKQNVPTMGGLIIVLSLVGSMLLWGNLTNAYIWVLIAVVLIFGGVGFLDDWIKLQTKSSRGLSMITKLSGQLAVGILLGCYLSFQPQHEASLYLPFLKDAVIPLGVFFIPFVVLVLVGSSNALNLTDGLDGLAVGCTLFAVGAFAVISYVVGHSEFAAYLALKYVPEAGEITVFCAAMMGASAGFLWFNCYPAEVMMGDTGSLALGGALGAVAILIKKEAVLVIVGGIFVWEALSVILQVASFKLSKRRIFKMSPFHHHLQLMGWPESKVTVRLWIIALILALVGLGTLKVR